MAGRLRVLFANLVWLLSCLPGWAAFVLATRGVRRAQQSLLARTIRRNRATGFGRRNSLDDFQSVPLSDYEDYAGFIEAIKAGRDSVLTRERVELLQPTSGSTAATKLIPCTKGLAGQFRAAVDPWIASMYLAFPSVLFGRHYWSISPSTPCGGDGRSRVRIGFADDAEYLGVVQRRLARALFAVPPEIARVADHDAFEYLTLLFLCREENLRLVSVWHPSFMTALLGALPRHFGSIARDIGTGSIGGGLRLDPDLRRRLEGCLAPSPARARRLARLDPGDRACARAIWPKLRVISCWTDGNSEPWRSELAALFPRAAIQGKGLAATEGIVSIPLGASGRKVCAVRSHYFEFIDAVTGEIRRTWEVERGREYSVVLTTAGGLYRYRLHDVVRVTGFLNRAPCLEFLGRDNLVSDIVGEKLNARHVESCIRGVEREIGARFEFAMLAPHRDGDRAGYVLFMQPAPGPEPDCERIAGLMEAGLGRNYHYAHARGLSQLEPVRIFRIARNAVDSYRRRLAADGVKAGDIKVQALSPGPGWIGAFDGELLGRRSQLHRSSHSSYA